MQTSNAITAFFRQMSPLFPLHLGLSTARILRNYSRPLLSGFVRRQKIVSVLQLLIQKFFLKSVRALATGTVTA